MTILDIIHSPVFYLKTLRHQIRSIRLWPWYSNITITILVVLYECETWSLTLREEHKLRVFEKRVLRRIFGPKRDEVTGKWRKFLMRSFVICTLRQL
jgi:hypothetical protein